MQHDPPGSQAGRDGAPRQPSARSRWGWHAVALAVYLAALGSYFNGFAGEDFTEVVPAKVFPYKEFPEGVYPTGAMTGTDHRFVVWLIARNAHTLLTQPWNLFDAEPCYPGEKALTFNEPGIALGVQAIPAWILSADPVATFNLTLFTMTLIHALAMYWLVREWTDVPAAGIVAGLLFAFHVIRFTDTVHVYVWDASWTILAFVFARRMFEYGRWRDAVGLAGSITLQIAGSFYPLVGAALLALPLVVWMVAHYGVERIRWAQWGFVVASIGVAVVVLLGPYLALRDAGGMESRDLQLFRPLVWLADTGEHGFPGWVLIGLALAGLLLARDRILPKGFGDPRLALLFGWLISVGLAFGTIDGETPIIVIESDSSEGFKNLYSVFAAFIPGFEVVRSPASLYAGAHIVQCIFAGFGAAALLRMVPPRGYVAAAAALIALAYVDTMRPATLGLEPRMVYEMYPLRPHPDALDLVDALDARGDEGPILELPVNPGSLNGLSRSVLLSAYHHRRTSQCYSPSRISQAIRDMNEAMPGEDAIARAREMGFTTLVVRHDVDDPFAKRRRRRFAQFAKQDQGRHLERLHGNDSFTAWSLRDGSAR